MKLVTMRQLDWDCGGQQLLLWLLAPPPLASIFLASPFLLVLLQPNVPCKLCILPPSKKTCIFSGVDKVHNLITSVKVQVFLVKFYFNISESCTVKLLRK